MKKIKLTSKKELNIYMSPVRQQLLRELSISQTAMTPKMLADVMEISASSIQHHLKKLMSLGLIELDHTELINGITASFYQCTNVTVQIGQIPEDNLGRERDALLQNAVFNVYENYKKKMVKTMEQNCSDMEQVVKQGDVMTGVAYLSESESENLIRMISNYLEEHSHKDKASVPWEYAVIAYNTKGESHD